MKTSDEEVISRSELIHAVKNSFNLINSIIDIQLMNTLDETCRSNLMLLSRRCKAIMLAQTQLVKFMEGCDVQLVDFLRNITEKLAVSHSHKSRFRIEVFGDPISLKVQKINYIGLLFSEVLSWIWANQEDIMALVKVRAYAKEDSCWALVLTAPYYFPPFENLNSLENSQDWFLIPLLFKQMNVAVTFETSKEQTSVSFLISG